MRQFSLLIAILLLLLSSSHSLGSSSIELDSDGVPIAAPEVDVDRAVLPYEQKSMRQLDALLLNTKEPAAKAILLYKLARVQLQHAQTLSRIAHEDAYAKRRRINLKKYKYMTGESIKTLDKLISPDTYFKETARAYYLRAQARAELGDKNGSAADFQYILKHFKKFTEIDLVYLSLAEYARNNGKHREIIQYLGRFSKNKKNKHYGHAISQMAWAYYHLENPARAFYFLKKYIVHYNSMTNDLSGTNEISKENRTKLVKNLLVASSSFYIMGFESKHRRYSIKNAYSFFKKITSYKGLSEELDDILMHFSKQLRAKNHVEALHAWSKEILLKHYRSEISLDIFLLVLEDQFNKRRDDLSQKTLAMIAELREKSRGKYDFEKAEKMVLGRVGKILNKKRKSPRKSIRDSKALVQLYLALDEFVEPGSIVQFRYRYNLAQSYIDSKNEKKAQEQYYWILSNWSSSPKSKKAKEKESKLGFTIAEVGNIHLTYRYEKLDEAGFVPKSLKPTSFEKDEAKVLSPDVKEWIVLQEILKDTATKKEEKKALDFYRFEKNRILYSQGYIKKAVLDLENFAKYRQDSEFAISAAKLVADTYIASKNWKKTSEKAIELASIKGWKNKSTSKIFKKIAFDSSLKEAELAYQKKDYKSVQVILEKSKRMASDKSQILEFHYIKGKTYFEQENYESATEHLGMITKDGFHSNFYAEALYLKARSDEQTFNPSAAVSSYLLFLKLPKEKRNSKGINIEAIREKVLFLSWMKGNLGALRSVLTSRHVCHNSQILVCDLYEALAFFLPHGSNRVVQPALLKSKTTKALPNKVVWSLLALANPKALSSENRYHLIDMIKTHWGTLDSVIQFSLIDKLSQSVPNVFVEERARVKATGQVGLDAGKIQARVLAIKNIEKKADSSLQLPWTRVQALVLHEIAGMYRDLTSEITRKTPRGLKANEKSEYNEMISQVVLPFIQSSRQLEKQAYDRASVYGIEFPGFRKIAKTYYGDKADGLYSNENLNKTENVPGILGKSAMEAIQLSKSRNTSEHKLRHQITYALKKKNLPLVAYYIHLGRERKILAPVTVQVLTAIALEVAGARAEAMGELEEVVRDNLLSSRQEKLIKINLIRGYVKTLSKDRALNHVKDVGTSSIKEKDVSIDGKSILDSWLG